MLTYARNVGGPPLRKMTFPERVRSTARCVHGAFFARRYPNPTPCFRMKTLITALISIAVLTATAQDHPKRTPLRVFATYEDLVADKPVKGQMLAEADYYEFKNKKEWIWLVEGGERKKVELEGATFWGFTGADGTIFRVFEGQAVACYALGNKCYYQGRRPYNMETRNYYMRDWVSDGPNGPIEEGKRLCEDIIEASSFKEAFKAAKPKREMRDSVDSYQDKQIMWYVDFFNRINGDSAVK